MTFLPRNPLWLTGCGVLLASMSYIACATPAGSLPADAPEAVELKTYDVPEEYKDDLRSMLRSALESEGNTVGRVSSGPGGTLLVVAPPRIQAGVREILSKGFEAPPVAAPVKLNYWLVVGRAVAPSSGKPPVSIVGGRSIPVLEPVLHEITRAQGPAEFAVLEQFQLTSVSQARAQTGGRFARVHQLATRTAEQIVADVQITLKDNSIQSQVMLEKGTFVVLGQAGFGGKRGLAFPDVTNDDVLTLYYVMAADLDS